MSIESGSSETTGVSSSEQEQQTGEINGREVEIQQHRDNAVEHLKEYIASPIQAAAQIITNPTYVGVTEAGKTIAEGQHHLIDACKEYNESVRIQNEEKGLDMFSNPLDNDSENDRDSWDREY